MKRLRIRLRNPGAYAMTTALLLIWTYFALATDGVFLTPRNLSNLTRQASVTAVLAVGMTFVIVAGSIDLSVGSLAGFLGAALAVSIDAFALPTGLASVLVLGLGACLGAFHGFLTAYQRIPAFIVTLGGLMVYRGGMLALTGGQTIPLPTGSWARSLGSASVPPGWGLPAPLVAVAVLAGLFWAVSVWTPFGRHLYATGGNEEAARLAGIDTRRATLAAFMLMGAVAGLAGLILTARVGSASPEAGRLLELDAIAACVIGGASLMGGRGGVPGSLLGALIMTSLDNGMSLANWGPFWQDMMKGAALVAAVWFDMRTQRSR